MLSTFLKWPNFWKPEFCQKCSLKTYPQNTLDFLSNFLNHQKIYIRWKYKTLPGHFSPWRVKAYQNQQNICFVTWVVVVIVVKTAKYHYFNYDITSNKWLEKIRCPSLMSPNCTFIDVDYISEKLYFQCVLNISTKNIENVEEDINFWQLNVTQYNIMNCINSVF